MPSSPNVVPLHRPGTEPDARLVHAALEGELWAKEALFKRHGRRLLGLAFRLMPEEDPEDLVQETFIIALRNLHKLVNPSAFGPWSSSVLVSLVRGRLRKLRRLRLFHLADVEPIVVENVISADAPPEAREVLGDVYRTLQRLTEEQRIAVVLQRVEGLELAEVAERMGVSVATVKRRVTEANQLLAEVRSHD